MKYVEYPRMKVFNMEDKTWLKNIYECIETPDLTLFNKVIATNKSTMTILQGKAMDIAKRTTLTYPEAIGLFMEFTNQNITNIESISAEEILEFLNEKQKENYYKRIN